MIQNVLHHIGGVANYGIFSLCLFFAVFLGAIFFAWRMKQSHADTMSALPLDDATPKTEPDRKTNS